MKAIIRSRWDALSGVSRALIAINILCAAVVLVAGNWLLGAYMLVVAVVLTEGHYWQRRALISQPFASLGHVVSKAIFAAIERGDDRVIVHIENDGDEKNWRVDV